MPRERDVRATIHKSVLPRDRDALVEFDCQVFGSDAFAPEDWDDLESYWMLVNGKRVGCCAFKRDCDFDGKKRHGSLYIVSMGILPGYRGEGLGDGFKGWQIAWARRHGFTQIVTNSRQSNRPMIRLNEKYGFESIGNTPQGYYSQPAEPAVVMELILPTRSATENILALLIAERDRVERAIRVLTQND